MDILVACKIVPDDQDVIIAQDGTLDFSRAQLRVSEYDLNAIEIAARLKEASEGSIVKLATIGSSAINDSKLKKNMLSRGADQLFMIADDACENLDSASTARELAHLISAAGNYDLIILGAGSADIYARQVGVHLADILGLAYVSAVTHIEDEGEAFVCTRSLESVDEIVEVRKPCVISVLPEIAQPRIAGMKDILAAGKKPMTVLDAVKEKDPSIEVLGSFAPEQKGRCQQIFTDSSEFAAAFKAAL